MTEANVGAIDKRRNLVEVDTSRHSPRWLATQKREQEWFEGMVAQARKERKILMDSDHKLTPMLADWLLTQHNPENRNISNLQLMRYETDAKAGDWKQNGETIKVAKDGTLNDGQHRCFTALKTGKSLPVIWVFGLDRESRYTVDQGKPKSAADYLSMEGHGYSMVLAAVGAMVWQYDNFSQIKRGGANRPTKSQIRETIHAHPGIVASIEAIPTKGIRVLGGHATMAFCHYILSQRDAEAADTFINKLIKGDQISVNSPIYMCRERLLSEYKKNFPPASKIELVFRTWNAWRTNAKVGRLLVVGNLPRLEA